MLELDFGHICRPPFCVVSHRESSTSFTITSTQPTIQVASGSTTKTVVGSGSVCGLSNERVGYDLFYAMVALCVRYGGHREQTCPAHAAGTAMGLFLLCCPGRFSTNACVYDVIERIRTAFTRIVLPVCALS